ncbi:hypothetical protein MO973_25320 [Paenibacillus sp. TRM 82003]|nr:hypothetical protein [Paenibacillus sp. TRM 82003]
MKPVMNQRISIVPLGFRWKNLGIELISSGGREVYIIADHRDIRVARVKYNFDGKSCFIAPFRLQGEDDAASTRDWFIAWDEGKREIFVHQMAYMKKDFRNAYDAYCKQRGDSFVETEESELIAKVIDRLERELAGALVVDTHRVVLFKGLQHIPMQDRERKRRFKELAVHFGFDFPMKAKSLKLYPDIILRHVKQNTNARDVFDVYEIERNKHLRTDFFYKLTRLHTLKRNVYFIVKDETLTYHRELIEEFLLHPEIKRFRVYIGTMTDFFRKGNRGLYKC